MSGLLYREDMDEVRGRLTTWWNGGDIGRPAMHIFAPREEPLEKTEPMPAPEGWTSHYSTSDFDYRVYLSKAKNAGIHFLGESVPFTAPDLAPNCLALFLGCPGVEVSGSVLDEGDQPVAGARRAAAFSTSATCSSSPSANSSHTSSCSRSSRRGRSESSVL